MAVLSLEKSEYLSDDNESNHPFDLIILFETDFDMFMSRIEELKYTLTQEDFSWLLHADYRSDNQLYDTDRIWYSPMTMWVLWGIGDHFQRDEEATEWAAQLPTGRMTGVTAEQGFRVFQFLVENGVNLRRENAHDENTITLINMSESEREPSHTSRHGEEYNRLISMIRQEYPETREDE